MRLECDIQHLLVCVSALGCVDLSVLINELDSALCGASYGDYILEGVCVCVCVCVLYSLEK